jgi:hypothetical protein
MTRHWQSLNGRSLSVVFGAVLILSLITNSATAAAPQESSATGQTVAAQAGSGVPRLFSFSGAIKDASGNLKTGVMTLTFSIYADFEGGTPLWSETQGVQLDGTGHYTVLVGATLPNGLPLDLFTSGAARWLGVQPAVSGVGEQPRVLLVGMPYALKAADADTLGGKPLSAFQLAVPESSSSGSTNTSPNGLQTAVGDQANEIVCSSTTACGSGFIPQFSSNGGSAKVSNSLISQSGSHITLSGSETATGSISGKQLVSTVATGTAPLTVNSTTQVANLNASLLGGLPAGSFATLGANLFTANQTIAGNGTNILIGNVGCGSPTAGIGIGSVNCNTFGVGFDGAQNSTFINRPMGGRIIFREGNSTSQMTINSGGSIGIGIEVPILATFEVDAPSNSSNDAGRFVGSSSFNGGTVGVVGSGGDTLSSLSGGPGGLFVGGSGGLGGLGGFGIEAFGGRNSDGSEARAGEFHGDVEVTGCLSVSPGTTAHVQFGNCLSDVRLKKNIQPYSPVLDKLVRLQPVTYNWRVEEYPQYRFGTEKSSGLIAQEVEKVFPEMVSVDEGGFRRVNYGELPLLMLQAIRDLKAENDSLREQLKARNQDRDDERSELAQLRAEVDRLAATVRTTNGATVQARVLAPHR